ncbi:MAG: heavy metal-binding domain-containing protein [Litorimonas sp.]
MSNIIIFIILLSIGMVFGNLNERRHFKRLQADEEALSHIKVYNLKSVPPSLAADLEDGGTLVTGNVVIAIDYFKRVIATIKMLIGGRLGSYESLVERARREAVIRMQKHAASIGATEIYNARIEFSVIGQQPKISGAELMAYGTAVKSRARLKSSSV